MTRVPALSPTPEQDGKQVDAAILQLIGLIARQAARETAADASDQEDTHHDATQYTTED
ncbi:hypothetical protein [Ruegeria marina]|uniref:hypothetical protein n=1 Tax=Ruegeria marina TaxID=639004 RepID=UPI0015A448A1|nr:hypothetical protein [Ruegeria marina]